MTAIDDIIIKPRNNQVFSQKQGSFFWPLTYRYESSDGLVLRSKQECDWHYLLSKSGIYHTYEPNIPRTRRRPDFGIANNFLLEVCGMVDSPLVKENDGIKKRDYKINMAKKRKELTNLGYNLIEVYHTELVLNGHPITDVAAEDFVIGIVKEYNPQTYYCISREIEFSILRAA